MSLLESGEWDATMEPAVRSQPRALLTRHEETSVSEPTQSNEIQSPLAGDVEPPPAAPADADLGSAATGSGEAGSELRDAVSRVIDVIRPAIQADNGDIVFHDVDDAGVVSVELLGACVTCPASTQTLEAGVQRILKDRVDGVTGVVNVGATVEDFSETVVSL